MKVEHNYLNYYSTNTNKLKNGQKRKWLFSGKMHLFVCKQYIYTNKWKTGKKENDFLEKKCIYEYVKGSWYFKNAENIYT